MGEVFKRISPTQAGEIIRSAIRKKMEDLGFSSGTLAYQHYVNHAGLEVIETYSGCRDERLDDLFALYREAKNGINQKFFIPDAIRAIEGDHELYKYALQFDGNKRMVEKEKERERRGIPNTIIIEESTSVTREVHYSELHRNLMNTLYLAGLEALFKHLEIDPEKELAKGNQV